MNLRFRQGKDIRLVKKRSVRSSKSHCGHEIGALYFRFNLIHEHDRSSSWDRVLAYPVVFDPSQPLEFQVGFREMYLGCANSSSLFCH